MNIIDIKQWSKHTHIENRERKREAHYWETPLRETKLINKKIILNIFEICMQNKNQLQCSTGISTILIL